MPLTDRPMTAAVIACLLTASILLILGSLIYRHMVPDGSSFSSFISSASEVFNQSFNHQYTPINPSPNSHATYWTWIPFILLLCIASARVEIYRQLSLNVECAPAGYGVSVPTSQTSHIVHFRLKQGSMQFPFCFRYMIIGATSRQAHRRKNGN